MKHLYFTRTFLILLLALSLLAPAWAGQDEDLAKQLQNPVADLISVPFQLNYDPNLNPQESGEKWTMNLQPVIPVHLNKDWNLICRTILPVIYQDKAQVNSGDQFGLGDVTQSFFFSPVAPTKGGWTWGVGPVIVLPTATNDRLGLDKWAAGPTAVALAQRGPWTYGALFNHVWSFAGDSDRSDLNASFFQPFLTYTFPGAWTIGANTESVYNWRSEKWSIPINVTLSKLTHIAGQTVNFTLGPRYWVDGPDTGPDGLGFRFAVTFLFPK